MEKNWNKFGKNNIKAEKIFLPMKKLIAIYKLDGRIGGGVNIPQWVHYNYDSRTFTFIDVSNINLGGEKK